MPWGYGIMNRLESGKIIKVILALMLKEDLYGC